MMKRIDQQLKVTKIIMDCVDLSTVKSRKLERYLERFLSIMLAVSSIHLLMIGDSLAMKKRRAMWRYLEPVSYTHLEQGALQDNVDHARSSFFPRSMSLMTPVTV